MKEMLLRNKMSKDKKKREYCIEEISADGKFVKKTQKNCTYCIEKDTRFSSWRDVLVWVKMQSKKHPAALRDITIIRTSDSRTRDEKVLMKITGIIYARIKGEIYSIKYEHSIALGVKKKDCLFNR
jgi:hypothetical protein